MTPSASLNPKLSSALTLPLNPVLALAAETLETAPRDDSWLLKAHTPTEAHTLNTTA